MRKLCYRHRPTLKKCPAIVSDQCLSYGWEAMNIVSLANWRHYSHSTPPYQALKWSALAATLIALASMIYLLNHANPAARHDNLVDSKSGFMEQPVIIEHQGDRLKWQLRAKSAEQGLRSTHMFAPSLELYDDEGKPILVRGDEAWFDPISRNIRFTGHVRIDYQAWRVQTSQAVFDGLRSIIHLPQQFTAQGDGIHAHGTDLWIDQQKRRLEVKQHIWIEDRRQEKSNQQ
ncbi:MAG: LPS export ABC transporter periplasmic protein LptC [Mariprofundales bacterium]